MKYNIKKRSNRFKGIFAQAVYQNSRSHFPNLKNDFLFKKAIINDVWQTWNYFWRTYWLAYVRGGIDGSGNRIIPLNASVDEEEAVYFLLNGNFGSRTRSFHEKTWGDIKIIEKVALNIINYSTINPISHPIAVNAVTVSSAISLLGNSIKDFQGVRNTSVHLTTQTVKQLMPIISRYRISRFKYPTEIASVVALADNKIALVSWHDEMVTFIDLVI